MRLPDCAACCRKFDAAYAAHAASDAAASDDDDDAAVSIFLFLEYLSAPKQHPTEACFSGLPRRR